MIDYRTIWERVLLDNMHLLTWFNYARKVRINPDGTLVDDWASQKTRKHYPVLIKLYEKKLEELGT